MLKKQQQRFINEFLPIVFAKIRKTPHLPKRAVLAIDIFFVAVSFFIASYIRYAFLHDLSAFNHFYLDLLIYVVITGIFFLTFNTYSEILRFSSFHNILRILLALFLALVAILLLFRSTSPTLLHYSVSDKACFIVTFLLSSCIILSFRMMVNILYDYATGSFGKKKKTPLLIYGIDAVHIELEIIHLIGS